MKLASIVYFRAFLLVLILLNVLSCGESSLVKSFKKQQQVQSALTDQTIGIFARDPAIDGNDSTLSYKDNLDYVPRTNVTLLNMLDPNSPIKSNSVIVYNNSTSARVAPTFKDWAGRKVPWKSSDFKSFMLYYHTSAAHDYAKQLFPNTSFTLPDYVAPGAAPVANKIIPLTVYSQEEGDAYSTSYLPSKTKPSKRSISFYESTTNPDALYLNFADSADAIYHEFAHALQHALNKSFLEDTTGYMGQAILEGLADFFAAAITRHDDILLYLTNADPFNKGITTGTHGTKVKRTLAFPIKFPDSFTGEFHNDGRILSSALNDFRKYLEGKPVRLVGTTTDITLSTGAVSSASAWDRTVLLSYGSLQGFVQLLPTFHYYSTKMLAACAPATLAWCTAEVKAGLTKILFARGLYYDSTTPLVNTLPVVAKYSASAATNSTIDIEVGQSFGWYELKGGSDNYLADNNINPCEAVMIFPNLINNSKDRSNVTVNKNALGTYWGFARISAISGFDNMVLPNGLAVEQVTDDAKRNDPNHRFYKGGWKKIGPIQGPSSTRPALETTLDLMNYSEYTRWYQSHAGAFLVKYLNATEINTFYNTFLTTQVTDAAAGFYFPDNYWLVSAKPSTAAATFSVTFDLKLYPMNADIENLNISDSLSFGVSTSITQTYTTNDVNQAICVASGRSTAN